MPPGLLERLHPVFDGLAAVSTFGLLLFAYVQVRSIRRSQTEAATLNICNAFTLESTLTEASARVFALTGGRDYSFVNVRPAIHSVIILLHFFDSLAIGIEQGLYIEKIVRERLGQNIQAAVDIFVTPEYSQFITKERVAPLVRLRKRWREQPCWTGRSHLR